MLEERFQTAETRPGDFPWRSAVHLAIGAAAVGAGLALAAVFRDQLGIWRGFFIIAIGAMLARLQWQGFREDVRAWQLHYGNSVEYVARRVREEEDGLRFKAP